MTEPFISPKIDALIDVIEEAGGCWHVIGGSQAVDPYLAFQLPKMGKFSEAVRQAMEDFQYEFDANVELRRAVIDFAMSLGAYYVEFGNSRPVIKDGSTVQ